MLRNLGHVETFASDGETLAEMHAFTRAVLPRVASCDAGAAEVLARNYAVPDDVAGAPPSELVPDGFCAPRRSSQVASPPLAGLPKPLGWFAFIRHKGRIMAAAGRPGMVARRAGEDHGSGGEAGAW